jgi:hypothetical protein
LENLAAYLIRASFSQQRMQYFPEKAQVVYHSKHGKEQKTYDALEWLAAMPACACPHADRGTHVPQRRQQSVKYYDRYANSTRGRLRKRQHVDPIPTVLEPPISSEAFRRNWARLIQKVQTAGSYTKEQKGPGQAVIDLASRIGAKPWLGWAHRVLGEELDEFP